MTRTILSVAFLAAPMVFASAAEACISCEYVPEVVRGSRTSDEPAYLRERPRAYVKARVYLEEKEGRPAPTKRIVKREPVDTDDTAPINTHATNENSSISVGPEVASIEKVKDAPQTENSSIALAPAQHVASDKAAVPQPTIESATKPVDCKKFFPSVGITLTVLCE